MPKRKDIKGIGFGFITHFTSRNNDISGYWAMGVLYKHACNNPTLEIKVDLLSQTITPPSQIFKPVIRRWEQWIKTKFVARGLPLTSLTSANIIIKFEEPSVSEDEVQRVADEYLGALFMCSIELVDDENRSRIATSSGRCRQHDPSREFNSNRVYS